LLIGIAYAAINLFNLYINLTGPVMFCFIYYSVARYYAFATARALDTSVVTRHQVTDSGARGCLLALRFDIPTREEALLQKLAAVLQSRCKLAPSTEWLCGRQRGLWRLLENTLVLCWFYAGEDERQWQAILKEAEDLAAGLPEVLGEKPFDVVLSHDSLSLSRAAGPLGQGEEHAWHVLLGQALQEFKGA
jgi:hypothetical protein